MWTEYCKGQTTMVFMILIIIIFVGMGVFLLSLAKNVSQSEYINLYTHNLLSSILKTETGFSMPPCRTVSDLLACSFLSPSYMCGSEDCFTLANSTVNEYVSQFGFIKEGFNYLFIVKPSGFTASLEEDVRPHTVKIGELSLERKKTEKFTANERIQMVLGENPYFLDIRLIIARKET
jgi:hypothetical protein